MEARAFADRFPKLYHVTFAANRVGIERHGLLSVAGLADVLGFDEEEREASLGGRRRCIQEVRGVSIRDQHAASEKKMKTCLVGVTIAEWLALLNSKVFFFATKKKALEFAGRYGDYANILVEVDTGRLVERYPVSVCRIHAGAFLYNPVPRGRDSFIPLERFVYRNKRDTPGDVTVDGGIPDVMEFATVWDVEPSVS